MSLVVLGSGFFFLLTAVCLVVAERYRGQGISQKAAKGAMVSVVIAGVLLACDVPYLGAFMDPYHAKPLPKKKRAGGGGGTGPAAEELPADPAPAAANNGGGNAPEGSEPAAAGAANGGGGSASMSAGQAANAGSAANNIISPAAAAGLAAVAEEKAEQLAELAACNTLPDMVKISAGIGRIGAPPDDAEASAVEKPEREARVWPSFTISRNEITFEQYKCFVDATKRPWGRCAGMPMPRKTARLAASGESDRQHVPATCLSWEDANAYAGWLSRRTGRMYRLPSALEWEYAARAAERDKEAGIELDEAAAKARAIYNMGGGVAEYVSDCWINRKKEADGAQDDIDQAAQPKFCPTHVLKDGAEGEDAHARKVWSRRRALPGITSATIGFRVVRNNN